jgi:hypothetical protein
LLHRCFGFHFNRRLMLFLHFNGFCSK